MNKSKSLTFILSCVVLWSFIPVVSRLGQQGLDNYQFLFWSSLLSFIVLFLSTFIVGKTADFKNYSTRKILIAFGLGFLGTFLYYLLLYFAYAHISGLEVLVIQYTWPIFIVLFSSFLLKEKLTPKTILSVILGFLGVILVLTRGNLGQLYLSNISMDLLVLLAASVFGLFSVLSKKADLEPFTGTTLFFLAATIFSFISMLVLSNFVMPTKESLIPILGNGILINGFSYVLWLKGLKYADASFAAPFVFLTPILAAILVVIFFNEVFLPVYFVGLLLVIGAGLITLQSKPRSS
ncbi:MAG: DMT family transporter [Patescibacteria group bacterium]